MNIKTDKKYQTPIILKTTYEALKKRWMIGFILANLCYLMIIALMGWSFSQDRKAREFFILQGEELDTLKTKERLYAILRNKGVSLSQGLDIAEVTMRQSRKLDLSMSLILAVLQKESKFIPYALSSETGVGLLRV